MCARQVLQKCLPDTLRRMHALRERALLHAMEALLQGRRLTLMDVACSWPDAERVRPPMERGDSIGRIVLAIAIQCRDPRSAVTISSTSVATLSASP